MDLTINNKYIVSPRKCYCAFKTANLCSFHKIIDNHSLQKSHNLRKLIRFVQNYVQSKEPIPLFWKSFNEKSSWHTLKTISLIVHLIWLLEATTNWIINSQDQEYDISKIGTLHMDIINNLSIKKTSILFQMEKILKIHLSSFSKNCHTCTCQYTISIPGGVFGRYDIGDRIDLMQKFLSEDEETEYKDLNSKLQEIANLIKKDLKKVDRKIVIEPLKDIPKKLWTDIFEKYSEHINRPIYFISDNDSFKIIQHEDDDSSDEPEDPIEPLFQPIFVYKGEKEPDPICRISFENQPFCILCDAYKKPKLFPKMKIATTWSSVIYKKNKEHKPYFCKNICNMLAFYANSNNSIDSISEEEYEVHYKFDFRNVRYATNRMLEFYTGCADPNSDLNLLGFYDIKKYIILKYLNLLGIETIVLQDYEYC